MKRIIMLVAAMLVYLSHYAQVDFSARVFKPDGNLIGLGSAPLAMLVDSEDTVRYSSIDSCSIVHFDNIPIGSRCRIFYRTRKSIVDYDYAGFSLDSNMYIDSLVLKACPKDWDFFASKVEKDSIMKCRVDTILYDIHRNDSLRKVKPSKYDYNINNYPHLIRYYYNDWINHFPSWRTWPSAVDSAYKYCLEAYNKYPYLYYLYYPLKQLSAYLGVEFDKLPPYDTIAVKYFPLPEMPSRWWADTTLNVLNIWEEYEDDNKSFKYYLCRGENSLCYPLANDGTVRLFCTGPFGGAIYIYRIQDDSLYYWEINRSTKRLEKSVVLLPSSEIDNARVLIGAFHSAPRRTDDCNNLVPDACTYYLEYVVDGKYYCYSTTTGKETKELKNIMQFFFKATSKNSTF